METNEVTSSATSKRNMNTRVAVVGVGNILLKDEGIGIHVVRALREVIGNRTDVELIDGGTSPDALLGLEAVPRLILVDATRGGGPPGSIYRFHPSDISVESQSITSLHQIGLLDSLKMMQLGGSQPDDIIIIGVEPKEIDWGMELSPELMQKLPQIVREVMKDVARG
jgi:hydrogenase maturation protease